jgi:hypothetical protein
VENMMARLLANIRTNQERMDANHAKTDANLEEIKEDIQTSQA